ncbi:MAG: YidC/Oxa1 family membrane protein insertase [Bacillota bacterium]
MSSLESFISQSIQFFYTITAGLGFPSYGIAIIMFTIAIKVVLMPLTFKQVRAMKVMQELQPQIQEIQKKHKNNPQKSQQLMMELYKEHKANPFSGCWPLLVQLPILFALFKALRVFFDNDPAIRPEFVNLDHAGFLWMTNLGQPDPYILPILVAVGTFLQQKITMGASLQQNPNQKIFLYFMPLFIGWISRTFPAALALYWLMYSVVGIFEQWLLRRPSEVKEEIKTK